MRICRFSIIPILFVIFLLCGCGESNLNSRPDITGLWIANFEATHFDLSGNPEDADSTYTVVHTSTMIFERGIFEITIDPPVQPFINLWTTGRHWDGQYFLRDNELTLVTYDDPIICETYKFEMAGDSLRLSLKIGSHIDENDDSYAVVPIYGGLPWGRAMLCHGGTFLRALK